MLILCLIPEIYGASATDFTVRRAGAEADAAIRIGVTNAGFYYVPMATLASAGVNAADRTGANARLFCRTQEVALLRNWPGAGTDGFIFFGQGYSGDYSATNVYWLGFGTGARRFTSRSAAPLADARVVVTHLKTIVYDAKRLYQDTFRPSDATFDHWFAEALLNGQSATVTLSADAVSPAQDAVFEIVLYGKSDTPGVNPDHCTRVQLNAGPSADFLYEGQEVFTGRVVFSATALRTINRFDLTQVLQPGVSDDYAYLKQCALTYTRNLRPEDNALLFDGQPGACNYRIGGWPADVSLLVCDITDPVNPVQLTDFQTGPDGQGGVELIFGDTRAIAGRYAVCHSAGIVELHADVVQPVRFRDLASTDRQADYIVICPYEFRRPVYRLLERRRRQGLTVAVAPLPDIYNEFNYGVADPEAIRQFLGYARTHWRSPAPRYILLAGTGTYDPRHYVYNSPEIIPVHLGPTAYKWTALDSWYAQVDGVVPAMALGRILVESADQMDAVVDKIIAFESMSAGDPARIRALLVSDSLDAANHYDFKVVNEMLRLQDLNPRGFQTTTVYLDNTVDTSPIVSVINKGVWIVNYLGHGAINQWSEKDIFNTNSVAALTNTRFPLFVMLTCQNGVFQSPVLKSLVEQLLESPSHGAAACLASAGLSSFVDGEYMGIGFFQALLIERVTRIGDALIAGYEELNGTNPDPNELLLFGLFGDPAMVVNGY